jgi:sialate O-acetylesterase
MRIQPRWCSRCRRFLAGFLVASSSQGAADFRPARVFSDNLVLQRDVPVPVWGWSAVDQTITVRFHGQEVATPARAGARWQVDLQPMSAVSEPQALRLSGSADGHEVMLTNVVVGDVWLCMGQSNMEMIMGFESDTNYRGILDYDQELRDTDYSNLRLLNVPKTGADFPVPDVAVQWEVSEPGTAEFFSAVAYTFGRAMNRDTGIPVGLINVSMGGAPIERFMPKEALLEDWEREMIAFCAESPAQSSSLEWIRRDYKPPVPVVNSISRNGSMYYGMIAPIQPYGLKGFVWYQGESNLADGEAYGAKLCTWIAFLREQWGRGDLPFLAVELAPYNYPASDWPMKDAPVDQRDKVNRAIQTILQLPRTSTINTDDLNDDLDNIHPRNKRPIGERLAEQARQFDE